MNSTELNSIRESLLFQKSAILNKSLEFKMEQSTQFNSPDEAELASQNVINSISIHLYERDRSALVLIEKALGKIDDGSYGLCEQCGDQIEVRRLQVRPFATCCIACMEEKEDSNNSYQ